MSDELQVICEQSFASTSPSSASLESDLISPLILKKPQQKKRKARLGKTPKEKIYWTREEVSKYTFFNQFA